MTKKGAFVLFIIAATVFNIIVTVICFMILLLLYSVFALPYIPDKADAVGFPLLFLVSLVLSFLIYQHALKLYLKKRPFPGSDQ